MSLAAGISLGQPVRQTPGSQFMDYNRWGWLLIALGLIALGVTVAMVVKMPA